MATEIERKFRVIRSLVHIVGLATPDHIVQSYLPDAGSWVIRIRKITRLGSSRAEYWMTLKKRISDVSCTEIEFPIQEPEYRELYEQCELHLTKWRYVVDHNGDTWYVDHFPSIDDQCMPYQTQKEKSYLPTDLVVAEIELESEDAEFDKPSWLGNEVTADHQFKNYMLAKLLEL